MSAVILAVIVVMWAVVLVPMWLRRHEASTESRSVDRFSTAMRVLSRRSAGAPDRRYVLMPKREQAAAVHVSGASAATRRPASRPATAAPPARPKPRPSLATRRRRALLAILGVTLLTFILMVAGAISWPLQFVVDLVLVAFVAHLRTQAKRTAAASRQRRRAAAAPVRPEPRRAPAPAFTPAPTYAPVAAPAAAAGSTYAERHYEPFEEWEPAQVVAEATGTDDATSDAWDPVPVPPPTYTMKPKAPPRRHYSQPAQPIDPALDTTAPIERVVDEPESDLDGILEHRWAVND